MMEFWTKLDVIGFALSKLLLSMLWQSSILLLAIWALAWLLRRQPASMRRGLWLAGVVAAPLLPLLAALLPIAHVPQVQVNMFPAQTIIASPQPSISSEPSVQSLPAGAAAPATSPASYLSGEIASASSPLEYPWALGLLAYATCLACFVAWIALGRLRIRAWLKQSGPILEERTLAIFKTAGKAVGLNRSYLLLGSPRVPAPLSFGVRHPAVLLPKGLPGRLSDDELKALAVHELAHIGRHDALALQITTFVRAVLFFQPMVWLGARRVSALSEQAADDAVLSASIDPVPYAKLLARLAEELPWRALSTELAAGILFTRGAFFRRIEAILSDQRSSRHLTRLAVAGAALSLIICIGVALAAPLGEKPSTSNDPAPKRVRVMTDGENLTLDGKNTTWEELPSLLANVPDRPNTIVEFAIPSDQLTLAQVNESLGKLRLITYPLEFKYLSNIGIQTTSEPKSSGSESPAASASVAAAVTALSYVDDSAEEFESINGSGHAVLFSRPPNATYLNSVKIFGSRYGTPVAPAEDFHVYILDEKAQVLKDFAFSYAKIHRGEKRWYTFDLPGIQVPENFHVALDFNPHRTKGVYLGIDTNSKDSHSFVGLPENGFTKWTRGGNWMVRADLSNTPAQVPSESSAAAAQSAASDTFTLGYVDGTVERHESITGSGHGITFNRPENAHYVEAIEIYASRYGAPEPPDEDFHVYLLNERYQLLADIPYPYSSIKRANMKWYTLETPAVEVPENFVVALAFNPHQTKGVYLGIDKDVKESHSLIGLPDDGYEAWPHGGDWMVRVRMASSPSQGREVKRLADWRTPVSEAPSSSLITMKYDSGTSAGKQSYGGSGPAISFKVADFLPANVTSDNVKLAGISFFASRYGSGYNTTQTFFKVVVLDGPGKVIHEEKIPYGRLSYNPRWIEIKFPTPLDLSPLLSHGNLAVAIDPEATQTKGIYFHYTRTTDFHYSSIWTPHDSLKIIADREWMIRAMLQK